ncbi:MAG: carboxymuconolactone decarboxylase family protein [Actinomycetota bacterium]|uniref:Carboxymuconolactone decarboxylase family protein n=1 Tax=Mycobacterium lentiflavum TaxID=141349 RepID=A0ABY3UMJ9_MYCLN|nr:carboxymuconolactone decarboxylase family protein [Mycobacterium lentiflavum]MEE3062922.1 carboxymuconolactone decarboxylase family protein [Actinomycetota bacterium]ULP40835.1 carboxymuconolactone decarboxylase family protein [Mycobacterium lentiflavum]
MVVPATVRNGQLTRLVSLALPDGRLVGLVRRVCAQTMSLPPLPVEVSVSEPASDPVSDVEAVVAEFAEQFSADVSAVTAEQRSRLFKALGDNTFGVVVAMYIADLVPRVRAGLEALGVGDSFLGWTREPIEWDHATDPSAEVFNEFLPSVGRMRSLDPVTSELVRLRGAAAHNCRLCKSVRESRALDAGGSETLYDDIAQFEQSELIDARAKAALRYVDGLIWTPSHLAADDVAEVRARFSEAEAVELTLDVMRNASNKIAVSLGGDAPRVSEGTETYLLDVDGQTVFS